MNDNKLGVVLNPLDYKEKTFVEFVKECVNSKNPNLDSLDRALMKLSRQEIVDLSAMIVYVYEIKKLLELAK